MASRTTATFFARSALSTTRRRRAEHTGHAPLFDRLEVEVLQDGACLPLDKRGVVALDQDATIAERAVTDGWRDLVQQDEIDGPPRRRLQSGGEPAEGVHVARRALAEFDCHVDVAARVQRAADTYPSGSRLAMFRRGVVCSRRDAPGPGIPPEHSNSKAPLGGARWAASRLAGP